MRLKSETPDAQRRELIRPETEALFDDGHYAKLREHSEQAGFDATTTFLIPVASMLVRSARRVLEHDPDVDTSRAQVKDRTDAGIREVKHVTRICINDDVIEKYRQHVGNPELEVDTSDATRGLSVFGEAIFRDVGWVAGGVVRAMQDEELTASPAETLIESKQLQRVGWIKETDNQELRLYLGMPYVKPEHITLEASAPDAIPIARFTPEAMQHIRVAPGQMGCPARRVIDPNGKGTSYGAEWNDMVTHLVPEYARADGPINAVFGA